MGLLSSRPLIDPSVSANAPRQAKRLADERKVSHVFHRNAKRSSDFIQFRAAAYARESVRSLLPEGR